MKKHHADVLGLALQDYLSGIAKKNIIVHSPDFEDDVIPVSYYFRDKQHLPALESKAIGLCRGSILDAGAGAGSHALILQENGMDTTALDISMGACEVMRKRGVQSVINGNIFDFKGGKFDTIVMLMNGIGLTKSVKGLNVFLKKIPNLLRTGGQLLFDSTNLIFLLQQDDGSVLLNLNDVYYGEVEFQLEYSGFISETFSWLYIDYDTLEWMSEKAGLKAEMILEGENLSYLARITF